MADPSPFLSSQVADDAGVYRPISGFAIAGLALSGLYTMLVLVSALMRFFWPGYMILLPILGVGLSILAIWQIRTAEGTRAGLKIAQWGVWLGVLSGGGYALYDAVTTFAIKVQANRFLMEAGEDSGFFPLLEKDERNAAFLLTQTYARRFGGKPQDPEAMRIQFDTPMSPSPTGILTQFVNSNLIRILHQASLEHGTVTVQPAGIRAVQYSPLKVARVYEISTPEVNVEVVVVVQATDNDNSEGRKWFVVWPEGSMGQIKPTPVGLRMRDLRMSTRDVVDKWIENDNRGALKVPQNVEEARIAAADRAEVIEDFKRKLVSTPTNRLPRMLKFSDPNFAFWKMTDKGKLHVAHSFQLSLLGDDGPEGYRYMGFGRFIVETPVPGDPRTTDFTPQWQLTEIILDRALPLQRK